MVATARLVLVQLPPDRVLVSKVKLPTHTEVVPPIGAGNAKTVSVVVARQPVMVVKLIIEVPAEIPVATPVDGSIVATPTLELLHVPPPGVEL